MTTEICPGCHEELPPQPSYARTFSCKCGALCEVTSDGGLLLKMQAPSEPRSNVPLPLMSKGTLDGIAYTIIGWVRYHGGDGSDTWTWEEWLLRSDGGEFRWLSFASEEGFFLLSPVPLTDERPSLQDEKVPVPGGRATVTSRSSASLINAAGHFHEELSFDDVAEYAMAILVGQFYSIEWCEDDVEIFEAKTLSIGDVGAAFDVSAMRLKMLWNSFSAPNVSLFPPSQGMLSLAEEDEEGALSVADDAKEGGVSVASEQEKQQS